MDQTFVVIFVVNYLITKKECNSISTETFFCNYFPHTLTKKSTKIYFKISCQLSVRLRERDKKKKKEPRSASVHCVVTCKDGGLFRMNEWKTKIQGKICKRKTVRSLSKFSGRRRGCCDNNGEQRFRCSCFVESCQSRGRVLLLEAPSSLSCGKMCPNFTTKHETGRREQRCHPSVTVRLWTASDLTTKCTLFI